MKWKKALLLGAPIVALLAGLVLQVASRRGASDSDPWPSAVAEKRQPFAPAVPVQDETQMDVSMSAPVRLAFTEAPYLDRKEAILALGKNLSAAESALFIDYLKAPMSAEEVNITAALKNAVMELLRGQTNLAGTWHRTLIELADDPFQHEVTRDYALQHLVDWYEDLLGDPSFEGDREEMRAALWRGTDETTAAIAGTALLGLHRLAAQDPLLDQSAIGESALRLLVGESTSEGSRVTSVQICGQMRLTAALPSVRLLAESGASLPLRAASVAALGSMGDASDLRLLEKIGPDAATGTLRSAVTAAVNRLTARIKG
jgi:hypothetical protein